MKQKKKNKKEVIINNFKGKERIQKNEAQKSELDHAWTEMIY